MAETTETREEREARWWRDWFAEDYSWEGLAKKDILGGGQFGEKTLQDYWRRDLKTGEERDDEALMAIGELVEFDGRRWHIAHLPPCGQGGRESWKADLGASEWARLNALMTTRLTVAVETPGTFDVVHGNWLWKSETSDDRALFEGAVLGPDPIHPDGEVRPISVSCRRAAFLGVCNFDGLTFGLGADFFGATFSDNASFDSATFSGDARFLSANFSGDARFLSANFSGDARFDSATFSGNGRFDSATFSGNARFDSATFLRDARFDDATFSGNARFYSATFSGDARFDSATFSGNASFLSATFSGNTRFDSATFSGNARFDSVIFSSDASFDSATFSGNGRFDGATFSGGTSFDSAAFSGNVSFDSAIFSGDARFDSATFSGDAGFYSATFSGDARFLSAIFRGDAGFYSATFSRDARFDSAAFSGNGRFDSAIFSGDARFDSATFSGTAGFDSATFSGTAGFDSATFSGVAGFDSANFSGTAGFDSATFSGTASFESATFSSHASFDSGDFAGYASFDDVKFLGSATLRSTTFSGDVSLSAAVFSRDVTFRGARFLGVAEFGIATFSGYASFEDVSFFGNARFEGVIFKAPTLFSGLFQGGARFESAVFEGVTTFFAKIAAPERDFPKAFYGARFAGIADFSGAVGEGQGGRLAAAFAEAQFEKALILTDGLDGRQGQAFHKALLAKTRDAAEGEKARNAAFATLESGCRVVKIAMGKARDEVREQAYYRLQLRARQQRSDIGRWERAFGWLYGWASDYGSSFSRPLVLLLAMTVAFGLLYWGLGVFGSAATVWCPALLALAFAGIGRSAAKEGADEAALTGFLIGQGTIVLLIAGLLGGDPVWQGQKMALSAVFRPFATLAEQASKGGPAWVEAAKLGLHLITTVQSLLSGVLIFLFGLAVKRRFQIS